MQEQEDIIFEKIMIGIIAVVLFTALTLVFMIPILNVFIAYKIFGEED